MKVLYFSHSWWFKVIETPFTFKVKFDERRFRLSLKSLWLVLLTLFPVVFVLYFIPYIEFFLLLYLKIKIFF